MAGLLRLTDTHNLVSTVGILLPQIAAANQGVADLKTELRAAEEKNDPKLVANLQSKLAEAQMKADYLSRELADTAKKYNPQVVPSPTPATPPSTAAPVSPDTRSLKEQGLQLANDINDWIARVSQDPRNHPPTLTPEGMQAQRDYAARLNTEWDDKFDRRPESIRVKLPAQPGVSHACLGTETTTDPSYILGLRKRCAELIEQGARNLP